MLNDEHTSKMAELEKKRKQEIEEFNKDLRSPSKDPETIKKEISEYRKQLKTGQLKEEVRITRKIHRTI